MNAILDELSTPHAVVDVQRVRKNIELVHGYAKSHGLALRPHAKTHKDPVIGALQIEAGAFGLTVATAREAEVMRAATSQLLSAYPPVDQLRRARLLALSSDAEVAFALDSADALALLSADAAARGLTVPVLVEVDLGGRRTGTQTAEDTVRLARLAADSKGTRFEGLMVHPGNLRLNPVDPAVPRTGEHPSDRPSAANVEAGDSGLRRLRADLLVHLEALSRASLTCKVVSGGNTPTLFSSHLVPELTEIRPGTYIYSDRDIASQGVLPWDSSAYSVLATVVSLSVSGQAVIDAGTKAVGKEPLLGLSGYGALLNHPEVLVKGMSEEHGLLDLTRTGWRPRIGERVQVVPNHVCVSVHLQDDVAFMDGETLSVRPVAARGR